MTSTAAIFLPFAHELADAARAVTLAYEGAAENKDAAGGFDPVTEADRGAERVMRDLIAARHPDHGVSGEEFGETPGEGRWRWSIDPIDGTRSFICGLPSWTTLIALLDEGLPVLGIIDVPRLDERFVAAGEGAVVMTGGEPRPLAASGCRSLADARLSTTDPLLFAGAEAEGFERVRRAAKVARYGYDAYAYARLAAGGIDLVIEAGLKPHDYNALIPVVRGAGGIIGDWHGGSDFSAGAVVAAATPALYDAAVRALGAMS